MYFDEIDLSGFARKFKLSTEAYQYVFVGTMHESDRGEKNSMPFDLNQILQLEHPAGPRIEEEYNVWAGFKNR